MDADFSHDPADIPRLIDAAAGGRPGARLALHRRRRGRRLGPDPACWSAAAAAIYARRLLGIGVHDLTGGFKVFRRAALEAIDARDARLAGYAFQVETTYRAIRAGLRVVEVPIIFSDRRVGESKMSGTIVAEAALRVPLLRLSGGGRDRSYTF